MATQIQPHEAAPPASQHQVVGLSFTAEQLEERRKTLGASEVPAVVGVNPFQTAADVWLSKRGLVPPFAGNSFTEWGLRHEATIAQKYGEIFGVRLESVGTLRHADEDWASATPDRVCVSSLPGVDAYGLEVKCRNERVAWKWGESGSDKIPQDVAVQCHWGMFVTQLQRWDVAVLFGNSDFRHYTLERDPEIEDALLAQCRRFWFDHVVAGVEPELGASDATREYLRQRFPRHSDLVLKAHERPGAENLLRTLATARAEKKHFETECERLENQLKLLIGDAAGIEGKAGRVSWRLTADGEEVDVKALRAKLAPDLLQPFLRTKPGVRTFRFTPAKED